MQRIGGQAPTLVGRTERVRSIALVITAAALAMLVAHPQAGEVACASAQFNAGAPGNFAAGSSPQSVALGDFNADGKQEQSTSGRID